MEQQTKKKHPVLWGIAIPFLVIPVALIAVMLFMHLGNKEKPVQTNLTYVSISTHEEYAYLNIKVETNGEITFNESDFAILINGVPQEVQGIVTEIRSVFNSQTGMTTIYFTSSSHTVSKNGTLLVSLGIKTSNLNNPTFLYQGQKLKLGEKLYLK